MHSSGDCIVTRQGCSAAKRTGEVVFRYLPRSALSLIPGQTASCSRGSTRCPRRKAAESSRPFGLPMPFGRSCAMRLRAVEGPSRLRYYGAEVLREFAARCPRFAADARTTIQAPYDPNRQSGVWEAKANSVALLGKLGDPTDVPLLLGVARGEEPALERGPRGAPVPSQSLMSHAVYAVGQIASAHVERMLAGMSADLLPDGVSRNSLLSQVRAGLSRLPAERVRILAPELLAADPQALMKLALTLRHVDVPAPAASEPAEAATSDASAAIRKETFRELAMVDLVVSDNGEARQRAVDAITRFGSAAAFIPLRNALVLRPWDTAWDIDHALRELTFTAYGRSAIADPNDWDDWWRRNRGMTRRQWAEEALSTASAAASGGEKPRIASRGRCDARSPREAPVSEPPRRAPRCGRHGSSG